MSKIYYNQLISSSVSTQESLFVNVLNSTVSDLLMARSYNISSLISSLGSVVNQANITLTNYGFSDLSGGLTAVVIDAKNAASGSYSVDSIGQLANSAHSLLNNISANANYTQVAAPEQVVQAHSLLSQYSSQDCGGLTFDQMIKNEVAIGNNSVFELGYDPNVLDNLQLYAQCNYLDDAYEVLGDARSIFDAADISAASSTSSH